ncbi:DUF6191 domain-containing protein [Kitasatospora sp. NPDC059827]|uniref:DUF6191 domain-containing protein n=1 Tax=Kitasatospora sp. NPDC059827 TaxID=3346964 RepID=UPI003666CACF
MALAAVGLVVLASWQVWSESSPRRRERTLGAGGGGGGGGVLGEMHALFSPGKRIQVEQRREQTSRRDDTLAGAPPHFGVDLDRGEAVLRRPYGDDSANGTSSSGTGTGTGTER